MSQPPEGPGWPVPDQPQSQPPGQPQGPPPGQPQWQPQWQPPPPKPKLPLFLGMLIGAVVPWFGVALPAALPDGSDVESLAPFAWFLLILVVGFGLLFSEQTRRWGAGILIGFFGMLIIGAGACVAVLVIVLSAYNGG